MADKAYVDELVLYLLEKEAEESKTAAGSSRNFRSDDVGHANPETEHREIQVNSLLESNRSYSANSFSPETGVASSLPTPLIIQGYEHSFDIPTWTSLAGAQQSISEDPEDNPAKSFLVPFETARGDFRRTDDTQSNPSEHSSFQHNIGWSNRGPVQKKSLGAEDSNCRKRENNSAEFYPGKKLARSNSAWSPQMSVEGDRNVAMAQMKEDYMEVSITCFIFPHIYDISNIEGATDSVSLGPVAGAEAVSGGGPSGIQARSDQNGKDKTFKCGICGKTFGQKGNLRRHEYTHTGKKPFKCSTCGKGFVERYHLERHFLVHSDERPHECTECPKRFRQKAHLIAHLWTHTKEKPFTCDMCGKKLTQKGSFRVHIRNHTGQEPHQCEVCRKDFAIETNCIEHQRTEHGWK